MQQPRPSPPFFFVHLSSDGCGFSSGQRAPSEEELEEDLQPVRRGEDAQLPGAGVRAAPLQAHAALLHGRDRRRAGLQERLHRRLLHLREFNPPEQRPGCLESAVYCRSRRPERYSVGPESKFILLTASHFTKGQ